MSEKNDSRFFVLIAIYDLATNVAHTRVVKQRKQQTDLWFFQKEKIITTFLDK